MAKKKLKTPKAAKRASKAERADAAIAKAAAKYRKKRLVRIAGVIGDLADQPPLLLGAAATIVAGAVLRKPRLVRAGARMLASELAATGMKALAKRFIARTRPGKMLKDGRYKLDTDADGEHYDGPWNSFPSGHSAGALAVSRALSREYPGALPVAALAAGIAALVQLPRGAHFPSDIAAGAAIGVASEALVNKGAALAKQQIA
ncbi:phosphatase PAP2 family protein [Sphingomonas sp. MMS12-HWE2-04]|uniref:phosphatase PAP2 family protein n=1 Tax=Sphingomonas sp. MMS12-HWE2-04 TaxID=3234199 RepID=UPI0038505FEB